MAPIPGAPLVALDRDGTILEYVPYLQRVEDVRLEPTAGAAIARLNREGIATVMVTNQSVVGRGLITGKDLDAIHERMNALLAEHDAVLDAFLVCPHAPADHCRCRKPSPWLLHRYLAEHGRAPGDSYVVGDNASDMEMALRLGARGIHVQTGVTPSSEIVAGYPLCGTVGSLAAAVALILGGEA